MKYILTAYLVFVLVFDIWGQQTPGWNVAYFSVQYGFAFMVSMWMLFEGRAPRLPYVIPAAVFGALVVNELLLLRCNEYFARISDNEPFLAWPVSFVIITFLLIILRKLI